MPRAQVLASPPSAQPVAAAPPPRYFLYAIAEAHPLPHLSLSKALAHSLLPARFVPTYTRWQRHELPLCRSIVVLAPLLSCSVLFVRAPLGCVLSIVSFVLQVPLVVVAVLALRTDVLKELMKTFEFWFFTFANTVTNIVMAMAYGDARALYLIPLWGGVQCNICIDAALHDFKRVLVTVLIGFVYHCLALAKVSFSTIPDVNSFHVIKYGPKNLAAEDLLMNSIGIGVYMFGRSLFRRGAMLFHHHTVERRPSEVKRADKLVRCVSYRCGVKLQPITINPNDALLTNPTSPIDRRPVQFVELDQTFDSRHTMLCGHDLTSERLPRSKRLAIQTVGILGFSLAIIMFLVLNHTSVYPLMAKIGAILSLALTSVYCMGCFALYHPGLLKYLCCSFDFCFLAAQFTFAHICAGYAFQWDLRVIVLASSFCWIMLILTIDALTPVARHKIGFHIFYILPVIFGSIVAHAMLAREVAAGESKWRLREDSMIRFMISQREYRFDIMSAFYNRLWMIMFWEFRALWRVFKATQYSCVIIHGVVELDLGQRLARIQPDFGKPGQHSHDNIQAEMTPT